MDRLCQHSTLVFAFNVTALLIISVLTDYWEYRIFNVDKIGKYLENHSKYRVVTPNDTQAYILIESISGNNTAVTSPIHFYRKSSSQEETADQPKEENVQFQIQSAVNGGIAESQQIRNGTFTRRTFVALYTQYGNLYRDCDALSTILRSRLGLDQIHEDQCFNFIFNHRDRGVKGQHIIERTELASFVLACVSVVVAIIALILGFIGILIKKKYVIVMCGVANLLAGLLLASAIGLFHYKLNINHQIPFTANGMEVPAREIINQTRVYRFGWSFYLAWSSVGLCLFTSWIWFVKAREFPMPNPLLKSGHSRAPSSASHRKQCTNGFDSDSNQDTDDDHLDELTRRKKKILTDSLSLEFDFH